MTIHEHLSSSHALMLEVVMLKLCIGESMTTLSNIPASFGKIRKAASWQTGQTVKLRSGDISRLLVWGSHDVCNASMS